MKASNRPFATYASASAAEPMLREMRIALRTFRARDAALRPLSDIETTKSDSFSLSEARTGRPLSVAGPSHRGREGFGACRVEDDAHGRAPVNDQPDRDAEDRDAVGVVHGPVEGVDDPDPATPRGGRLARDGTMLPGLLGKDRVAREAGPDRVEDQRLGQVIRLGHHVPRALVVDPFEPLVAIHQDGPGPLGDIEREGQLVRVAADAGGVSACAGHHGALHRTSSGFATEPNCVSRCVNVIVSPGSIRGLSMSPPRLPGPVRRVASRGRSSGRCWCPCS